MAEELSPGRTRWWSARGLLERAEEWASKMKQWNSSPLSPHAGHRGLSPTGGHLDLALDSLKAMWSEPQTVFRSGPRECYTHGLDMKWSWETRNSLCAQSAAVDESGRLED